MPRRTDVNVDIWERMDKTDLDRLPSDFGLVCRRDVSGQVASIERSHLRMRNLSFAISSSPASPPPSILAALNRKPPCLHKPQVEWEEPSFSPPSFSFELTGACHRALQRFTSCCLPLALCFVCKILTTQFSVSYSNISDCSSQRSTASSIAGVTAHQ